MARLITTGTKTTNNYVVATNKPLDNRWIVKSVADLTDTTSSGVAANVYTGLVVYVSDTKEFYVYTNTSTSPRIASKIENWKKLNVDGSDFKPEDYTSYYGVKVKDTPEELTSVENAYQGMLVYVKDNADTSEDESGLYILAGDDATVITNWKKVTSGGGSGDVQSVITTDGTIPTSNSGITVTKLDSTDVEEVYADDETGFIPNTYYTSRGLNMYPSNDGDDTNQVLKNVDYITLKGDDNGSYIRLYSGSNTYPNWITIHFASDTDNSLGFKQGDIKYIDAKGSEHVLESDTLELKKGVEYISFIKNVKFGGLTETRVTGDVTDQNKYEFNSTGSKYYDLDIYSENVLPKVTAYSNGTAVQLLTTADKTEIVNMITQSTEPDSITDEEIMGLFDNKKI